MGQKTPSLPFSLILAEKKGLGAGQQTRKSGSVPDQALDLALRSLLLMCSYSYHGLARSDRLSPLMSFLCDNARKTD